MGGAPQNVIFQLTYKGWGDISNFTRQKKKFFKEEISIKDKIFHHSKGDVKLKKPIESQSACSVS